MPEPPPPPERTPCPVARPVASLEWSPLPPASSAPMRLEGMPRREAALDLALVLLVAVLVPFTPSVLAQLTIGEVAVPRVDSFVILLKWMDALLVGGLAAYLLMRHRRPPETFGLRGDRVGLQLLWGAGTLAGAYAYMACTVVLVLVLGTLGFFEGMQEDLEHRLEFAEKLPVSNLGATILLLIPVAIHEELLFRGLLLPYLRRVTGHWWLAIAISSVLFGSLHLAQGWLGALQVCGLAVVLSVCFLLSRSLAAVAIAHFAFDFLQFQLIRLLPNLDDLLRQG